MPTRLRLTLKSQGQSFDVLVANPPFAVEGFLQTLSDADKNEYKLIEATGENSNTDNIECFFLERIHHLMAPRWSSRCNCSFQHFIQYGNYSQPHT